MRHDRALSETFSVVIIALLVVAAAILLVASLTGVITNLLQKPALFSVHEVQYDTSSSNHLIGLFHQKGDSVNVKGTSHSTGITTISLTITEEDGHQFTVSPSGLFTDDNWSPGKMLYISYSGGSYLVTDVAPVTGGLSAGSYTVKIIDDKAGILIHTLPITIQ